MPLSARGRLGVTIHQRVDLLDHVASLGLTIARIDANRYDVQRNGPDDWQWSWLDALVDGCLARQLIPYPVVGYTPSWEGARHTPPNIHDWVVFIREFGARYAGKVQFVGIWNEPNSSGMFDGSVEQYVDHVLIPAAETLRAIHPDYTICAPELSTEGRWWVWLEACLRRGGSSLDIVTVHSYQKDGYGVMRALRQDRPRVIPRWVPWPSPSVRQVMSWAGVPNMKLALTEFGWNTARISEEQQATYYDQFFSQMVDADWLVAAVAFNMINESSEVQWGLLKDNLTEKLAAGVIRRYAGEGGIV